MPRLALAIALALLSACAPRSTRPEPPRPDTLRVERLSPGVTHEFRWYANGPIAIHALKIDPRACAVPFRTIKAGNRVIGRATTSALAKYAADSLGLDVIGATNADFFSYDFPGLSEGPQMSNGRLLKTEGAHREAIEDRLVRLQPIVAFGPGGKRVLMHTRMRGAVRAGAKSVPLAGVNLRTRADSAFVFDSFYGDVTSPDTGALKLVVQRGVVIRADTAANPLAIPADGFVVSARGTARASLAGLANGDSVRWTATFDGLPTGITEMIGGYPMLLLDGKPVHHDEPGLRPTFSDRQHPRSVIGWGKDRFIYILAVDGRRPGYSEGLSLAQLGDYLLAHGFTDALNFDGGGSTTLVAKGAVVNRPTDTDGERAVSNALLVLGCKEQ